MSRRPIATLIFCLLVLVTAATAGEPPPVSSPRGGEPVAAFVNDDVITLRDMEQRTRLALLISNLPDTLDTRVRLQGSLLRRLIDERLEIQAAARQRIVVTPDDITAQMEAIEQQNHMPPGGFVKLLASKGIEADAMRQQIRAEIAWSGLVHRVLAREVHISEGAVSTRLDAIRANLGKPEYRIAEIFLSVENSKDEAEVRDLAERLIAQLRQGAPFTALAQQFSQTGGAGSTVGWVSEGMLDDDLLAALAQLQPNSATPPIRTTDGYHILMLLEKRQVGEGLGSGPTLDLMTLELHSLPSASAAERSTQMRNLRETLAPAKNCDDLRRLSRQVPSATITVVEKLPENQVPTAIVPLIRDLPPGQISEPLDAPKSRRFFAVCERTAGNPNGLPSADDIRRHMEDEQLELVARRHLRDLRRDAFIDIRK